MIARYIAAVAGGGSVTFGLLFIMQLLIATGEEAVTDAERVRLHEFVLVERTTIIKPKNPKPEKPPEPEDPPDIRETKLTDQFDKTMGVFVPTPTTEVNLNVTGVGFGVSDGEYLPIVKVAPVYPSRALSRGLEGHVIVEFTVTQTGAVKDVFVVESTSSLFERAAVEAAYKFKYKPRVIDGAAVEVPGVRNKITFEITQ